MIGRKEEKRRIEEMASEPGFGFLVLYGRRRVGKTTLLKNMQHRKNIVFFSAQQKNNTLNLKEFSVVLQDALGEGYTSSFSEWADAFSYISRKAEKEKVVIIIDEFPFLAESNISIMSQLQHIIDHEWKLKNLLLILCGSSISFMQNEVVGYKSPLYGRATEIMELKSFDYYDSSLFFENYTNEEKIIAYGILGGIPRYLEEFSDKESIEKNIAQRIIREGAFLYDEPQMLLRIELREPTVYNSILEAIAGGANKITEISDRIHEEKGKCSNYLKTLQGLHLVERNVPCTENERSKKALYTIKDNYFKFWFRFPFANRSYYEWIGYNESANEIMTLINDYMGIVFEEICTQYLVRLIKARKLPFVPRYLGKWWGNNPVIHAQDDVDVLGIDSTGKNGMFCECKFTNRPMEMKEYDDLVMATKAFTEVSNKYLFFISKGGYTLPVINRAKEEGTTLLTLDDLFELQ